MTDIVERLRRAGTDFWAHERPVIVAEAADEIERLRAALDTSRQIRVFDTAEIARLRQLLGVTPAVK